MSPKTWPGSSPIDRARSAPVSHRALRIVRGLALIAAPTLAGIVCPAAALVPISGIKAVAMGAGHNCALTGNSGVLCWGANDDGQLGDGTTIARSTPTPVKGLHTGVTGIAAGSRHACALTRRGGVMCWGRNVDGQLGDGTRSNRLTPTPARGLNTGIIAIDGGRGHTCALTTDGAVLCWGRNDYGQLGDGTTIDRVSPTPVTGLDSGVVAIAAGGSHTCALTNDGAVLCWGYNSKGALGDGTTANRATPAPVIGHAPGVTAIEAGSGHTCALAGSGSIQCWGGNAEGQVGNRTPSFDPQPTPVTVTGLDGGVVGIAAGYLHTCAITTGGALHCWGNNASGEIGVGVRTDPILAPTPVSGLETGVTAVASGIAFHTCALVGESSGIKCWGENRVGGLGDGTQVERRVPVDVLTGPPLDCTFTATVNGASSVLMPASGGTVNLAVAATCNSPGVLSYRWMRNGVIASTATSWTDTQQSNSLLDRNTETAFRISAYEVEVCGTACMAVPFAAGTPLTALVAPATRQASTTSVVEFYNAELDHYFVSWVPDEIARLVAGTTIKGWLPTGRSIDVYTAPGSGTSPVCRYYIPPALGDSHFYGRGTAECEATGIANPSFVNEDPLFFHVALPDAGSCSGGTVPVYRVFSNRTDANHRYTTDRATRDWMVGMGWLAEGDGADLVVMCAPPP